MKQIAKEDYILSIETKLNALTQQLSDLERRLNVLERSTGILKTSPTTPKPVAPQPATKINHTYLNRAISAAKHDYDRKR